MGLNSEVATMFKIGDFSKLSQVSVKTLRYYDELGLLKPQSIDRWTSYRYYEASQLRRLNRILALKDLGFSSSRSATSSTKGCRQRNCAACYG